MASSIVAGPSAPAKPQQAEAQTIIVRLSPTIQRHYREAGQQAELLRMVDQDGHVSIGVQQARALLADAQAQRLRRDVPKGTPKAFTALAEHLSKALGLQSPAERDREERDSAQRRKAEKERRDEELKALTDLRAGRPLEVLPPYLAQARRDQQAAIAEVEAQKTNLADGPSSPADFCREAGDVFWMAWNIFWRAYIGRAARHESGFRFTARFRSVLEEMANSLHAEILYAYKDEDVEFRAEQRGQKLRKVAAESAKKDFMLGQLLERVELAANAELAEGWKPDQPEASGAP